MANNKWCLFYNTEYVNTMGIIINVLVIYPIVDVRLLFIE
jgi:hypothetical protein